MTPTVTDRVDGALTDKAEDLTSHDERRWDEQFAGSLDVLEELHDEITAEYEAERTIPINA